MKTSILFILIILPLCSFSQDPEETFNKNLDTVIKKYSETETDTVKIIQDKLLNERLNTAFNQVVFSGSDFVNNASAFGVNQNEEKTNVSLNANVYLYDYHKYDLYLKSGVRANGSGSIFNLYTNDEWSSSVGGNLGLIFKFCGSGYTNESTSALRQKKALRKLFIRDSIMRQVIRYNPVEYKNIRDKYLNIVDSIINNKYLDNYQKIDSTKSKELKKYYQYLKNTEKFWLMLEDEFSKNSKLDFSNYSDSINKNNEKIINKIYDSYKNNENSRNDINQDIIKDVAYVYDKKNVKNTGYSFWWIDANVSLTNSNFNFSEEADNIESDILDAFTALDAQKTGINRLNTVLSANLNYHKYFHNGIFYIQGGFRFNSGSFLNSNLIKGTAKISSINENGLFEIKDEEGQIVGDFNSISRNLQFGSMDLYGAWFIGKTKTFGLNLTYSHNYNIKTPDGSFYENNYSILAGPIFRVPKKDDDTGLTFGIDVGFENSLYDEKASDNFVARVRVGIPVKLFNIKKK